MILRAGENVYCVEIENCISDHPEIEEAAVIETPLPRNPAGKILKNELRDSDRASRAPRADSP